MSTHHHSANKGFSIPSSPLSVSLSLSAHANSLSLSLSLCPLFSSLRLSLPLCACLSLSLSLSPLFSSLRLSLPLCACPLSVSIPFPQSLVGLFTVSQNRVSAQVNVIPLLL